MNIVKPTINILNLIKEESRNNQESKQIIFLDTNNLCGYAMSKFVPTSRFNWINPKDFDLNKYTHNSSEGCIFEVDLEYLEKLMKLHDDYPLATNKIEIKTKLLSD